MSNWAGASIIRWAGSKRQLLPTLVRLSPKQFRCYYEPFAGSACLFFALNPDRAVLGDINAELLNAWHAIRQDHRLIRDSLTALPVSKEYYQQIRAEVPQKMSPVQRAVRFLYLNRFCYNAVYRTNQSGQFNVPMGTKTGGFPNQSAFAHAAASLSKAELRLGDFEACLTSASEGDFAYLDPPYSGSRRYSGEYGYGAFSSVDEERLLATLLDLDSRGVKVLLSYKNADSLAGLPGHWRILHVQVQRHVSGFSKGRGGASEVILSNFLN